MKTAILFVEASFLLQYSYLSYLYHVYIFACLYDSQHFRFLFAFHKRYANFSSLTQSQDHGSVLIFLVLLTLKLFIVVSSNQTIAEAQPPDTRGPRGDKPIFECFWNGRLIPYTKIDS